MRHGHRASLYRKSGTATRDSHGALSTPWAPYATGVAGDLQESGGRLVPGAGGQQVSVTARFFVAPAELPAGVEIAPGDAVVITHGRSSRTTFLVHSATPRGERSESWDDEVQLTNLDETVTS